ncbi:hypothetical protein B0H14DRAFT_2363203, partial [Mycena olivaceomarginata]
RELARFNKAESRQVMILQKYRELQGRDHLHTLRAIGGLASTYHRLGWLTEAENLHTQCLER